MRNVLIVEDDVHAIRAIARFLESRSYTVRAASSRPEVLAIVNDGFVPDLLLTDWHITGDADGVDVARGLLEDSPDLRVVFMTSFSVDELAAEVEEIPVFEILPKPLRLAEVDRVVREALDQA